MPSDSRAPTLTASSEVKKNKEFISEAVSNGTRVLVGKTIDTEEPSEHRMRPILVEGVTKDTAISHRESFGPTVSLLTVDTEEEAVTLANDTEYGLSASVVTRDLAARSRVAKEIELWWVSY